MEIQGKILSVLPETRFNGKNGEVVKNFFVVETKEQYPQKIKFEVFGVDRWNAMQVANHVGADVSVQFDIKGAEWQGKYFVNLQAWKVMLLGGQQPQSPSQPAPAVATQSQSPAPSNNNNDDKPF